MNGQRKDKRLQSESKNMGKEEWPLGDSNPDTFRHKILSLACLPISPSGQSRNPDTPSLLNGPPNCEFLATGAQIPGDRPTPKTNFQ